VEWVVWEGVGAGGEITQALYAHMNNKKFLKNKSHRLFDLVEEMSR
jgi:hypothetical protein